MTMAPTRDKGVEKTPQDDTIRHKGSKCTEEENHRTLIYLPPPASRHRGLLSLTASVPLYDFGERMEEPNITTLINEARNAKPLFHVQTICTGEQQPNLTENDLVEIMIRFFGVLQPRIGEQGEARTITMMKEIKCIMPKVWTPRMYLGAINVPIDHNKSILIEAINFRGKRHISINEVHWLFTDQNMTDPSLLASRLISKAAYYNITGGQLKS